jgi:hypothetical protein
MLEDLLPFIFMLLGMVAVGVTLLVVVVRRTIEDAKLPPEYRQLTRERDVDFHRPDPENSAGRGSGFQG